MPQKNWGPTHSRNCPRGSPDFRHGQALRRHPKPPYPLTTAVVCQRGKPQCWGDLVAIPDLHLHPNIRPRTSGVRWGCRRGRVLAPYWLLGFSTLPSHRMASWPHAFPPHHVNTLRTQARRGLWWKTTMSVQDELMAYGLLECKQKQKTCHTCFKSEKSGELAKFP